MVVIGEELSEELLNDNSWEARIATSFPQILTDFVQSFINDMLSNKNSNLILMKKHRKSIIREDVKCLLMEHLLDYLNSHEDIRPNIFFNILRRIPPPTKLGSRKYCGNYRNASSSIMKRMKFKRMTRLYSELWLAVTTYVSPRSLTGRRALMWISERVLDRVENPTLFSDFFFSAFQMGHPVNLSALQGVFKLVHEHDMEYPDFYQEVYALIHPVICYEDRERDRFFKLVDLMLSSTHLPSSLVASFCKRLSRLLLNAPVDCSLTLMDLIANLLVRHPTLKPLLCSETEETVESDPFDNEEADPLNANALDSSLWELKVTEGHWHPDVSRKAVFMLTEMPKVENTTINWAERQLIYSKAFRKRRAHETQDKSGSVGETETPLSFVPPKDFFSSDVIDFESCFNV